MKTLALDAALVLLAAWFAYEIYKAKRCVCNRPDCGGGCGLR